MNESDNLIIQDCIKNVSLNLFFNEFSKICRCYETKQLDNYIYEIYNDII